MNFEVNRDEYKIANSGKMVAEGVYQCIVLVLYDTEKKIAGMYHIAENYMFIEAKPSKRIIKKAIRMSEKMLGEMIESGANTKSIRAIITGGIEINLNPTIKVTFNKIKSWLDEKGIETIYADMGGLNIRREVTLSVDKGTLLIFKRAESRNWEIKTRIFIPSRKIEVEERR